MARARGGWGEAGLCAADCAGVGFHHGLSGVDECAGGLRPRAARGGRAHPGKPGHGGTCGRYPKGSHFSEDVEWAVVGSGGGAYAGGGGDRGSERGIHDEPRDGGGNRTPSAGCGQGGEGRAGGVPLWRAGHRSRAGGDFGDGVCIRGNAWAAVAAEGVSDFRHRICGVHQCRPARADADGGMGAKRRAVAHRAGTGADARGGAHRSVGIGETTLLSAALPARACAGIARAPRAEALADGVAKKFSPRACAGFPSSRS